jgi:HTH-type transcriptional regulator/antitoxin HigA
MDIHPIRNDRDHARAMRQIEKLWGAAAGTSEADALEVLVTLVDAYEAKRHPIDPPDPIEAIKFRMEQKGLTRADLEPMIGSRGRVSEVLNGQRPLTITMIKKLRKGLGISADVLLGAAVPPKTRKKTAAPLEARPQ